MLRTIQSLHFNKGLTMSESTDVLDQDSLSRLLDVIGGDTSDLAELIESFLSEIGRASCRERV